MFDTVTEAQNSVTAPQTALDISVVTNRLLAEWQNSEFAKYTKFVKLSPQPDVFGLSAIGLYDIRIWRRGLPKNVRAFVKAALEVFGDKTSLMLDGHFYDDMLILNENKQLVTKSKPGFLNGRIDEKDIVYLFSSSRIDPKLSYAFAEHYLGSLKDALGMLPEGTGLTLDGVPKNVYRCDSTPFCNPHLDTFKNLLLHYTFPGTVYIFPPDGLDGIKTCFQSTAGDISIHGHANTHCNSSAPLIDGKHRLRICSAYQIWPSGTF